MRAPAQTRYDANLAAWPAFLPRLVTGPRGTRVRVEDDGGAPALLIDDGGKWLPVHSRRDPWRDAERSLSAVDLAGTSTLFVIGLGLGYVLDVLERQGWSGKVVAFEPEAAAVHACLQRRDWRAWLASGRLAIVIAPECDGLDRVVPTLDPNRDVPILIVNPVIARVYASAMDETVRRAARAWFGARANQEARRRNSGRYLLNTLRNAPRLATAADVDALADRFAGLPALVVAAGPSLERNLAAIAAYRDRAVVIAVDTALRPLLADDVHPDFVVAVDPSEANARHLVDLPACPDTFLVAEGSLDPEALRTFGDRVFFFRVGEHQPWPWLRQHGVECGRLRAWGSVLTTAFDLALRMGCDPIVFAGADLGFTDGQPYARGTTYEEDWRREEAWGRAIKDSWAVRVAEWPETLEPGIADVPVRTAPHLRAFRDWLVAESGRATGRRIVNATGRGILLGPAVHLATIEDVLQDMPPLSEAARRPPRSNDPVRSAPMSSASVPVAPDVMHRWRECGQVSEAAIEHALGRSPTTVTRAPAEPSPSDSLAPPCRVGPEPTADPRLLGLSQGDIEYVASLERTHTLRWLELRDASQDLTAQLKQVAADVTAHEAIVVVDRAAQAVGGQVRRAVDALLCERLDLWLDYRRFADRSSAISVIRADVATRAPDLADLDRAKWDPLHAAVADRLTEVIVEQLQPRSVIDVGCGAGYWLQAFERRGADRVVGLTPGDAASAAHPAVRRCDVGSPSWAATAEVARDSGFDVPFDLCLALEVAQELPMAAHAGFVAACTTLSDVVVFSSRIPGAPGASPYARPLTYWAELFWRMGYRLADTLRPRADDRWGFPWTLFDVLVVFRRVTDCRAQARDQFRHSELSLVARVHELYQQALWWSVRANAVQAQAPASPEQVTTPRRTWNIPAWRMGGEPGATRTIAFRTDAARWYLTDPRAEVQVVVDGRELPCLKSHEALAQHPTAGWVLTRDELTIKSGDGSDPRSNGRQYGVRLPAFVAWAEEQSLADCLSQQL